MARFSFKRIISLTAIVALLFTQVAFTASAAGYDANRQATLDSSYYGVDDDPEKFKYSSDNYVTYDDENGQAYGSYSAKAIKVPYTPYDNTNLKNFQKVDGIDVSQWQGAIDWKKVAADGIKFAFVRVGFRGYVTGKIGADDTYAENLKAAKEAGLEVGVYFYSQAITTAEAEAEADFTLNAIKNYDIDLPVVYDIESVGDNEGRLDKANLSKDQLSDLCTAFCARVEKAGYKGMVYANKYWLTEKLNMSKISPKYQVWIARYVSSTTRYTDYSGDYSIWQYTADGTVNGINGKVDMNRMYLIPPSKVQNVRTFNITSDSISFAWDSSARAETYLIEQYNSNGIKERTFGTPNTSCKIPGLTAGNSYVFKIIGRSEFDGTVLKSTPTSCFTGTTGATPYLGIDKSSYTIRQGGSFSLNVYSQFDKSLVTWSSSNSSVATVSGGTVTGRGDGTAIITASLDGSTAKATCIVTVQGTSVSLAKTAMTMGVGERYTLTTKGTKPVGSIFTSSDTSVVSVSSSSGVITCNKVGSATITITAPSGVRSSCKITVKSAPTSVKLNRTSITMGVGETYDLNSTVSAGSASHIRSYSSNNSAVATAPDSIIQAKTPGKATITVRTYNGKTATCTVTVKAAPTSVTLNKTSITLGVGETYDLNSSVNAGSASHKRAYSSNNSAIATVPDSIIKAKAPGTAMITVKTYNNKIAVCQVTVKPAPTSISLNRTSLNLNIGDKFDLNSTVNAGSASYVRNYTSSNSSVATAPGSIVNAKAPGTAVITVSTYNGVKTTCTVTVSDKLSAPSSLKATNPSSRKIVLNWSKVNGASGYELYRSRTSSTSGYTKIKTMSGTTFENTEMTLGRTYYYRVRAYKKVGSKTYYSPYKTVTIRVAK